jgi:flavin reductase (DIM6/NTAB) family NADH-FMN oxidoreductase RutF
MSIDESTFKAGMRCLSAGVNVITSTAPDGQRYGMTATAVCSVSAQPPTVLVCVNTRNSSLEAIRASGAFAVNVLATDDQPVASAFASALSADEKFAVGQWLALNTGAPVLSTALVGFDCKVIKAEQVGTHEVVFGEIVAAHFSSQAQPPLLYAQGAYGTFAAQPA